jgi:hypothetical protein
MATAGALVGIGLRFVVLSLAVVFAVQSSRGDAIHVKVGKLLGLLVSVVPIVSMILFVIFRGKSPEYAQKCIAMAGAGVCLYILTRPV